MWQQVSSLLVCVSDKNHSINMFVSVGLRSVEPTLNCRFLWVPCAAICGRQDFFFHSPHWANKVRVDSLRFNKLVLNGSSCFDTNMNKTQWFPALFCWAPLCGFEDENNMDISDPNPTYSTCLTCLMSGSRACRVFVA